LIQYISATCTYMASLDTIYFSHIYVCGVSCYNLFQPHIRIWRLLIPYISPTYTVRRLLIQYISASYTYVASLDKIYFNHIYIHMWRLLIQYISATYMYVASLDKIYFNHIYSTYICGVSWYNMFQLQIRMWRLLIQYISAKTLPYRVK
jgi:hypothetical protein